jgi:hypothetical protein
MPLVPLAHEQILSQSATIAAEFDFLLNRPGIARSLRAKQWQFFRHTLEVLLGLRTGDYDCTSKAAANYRQEIEERISAYYGSPGGPVPFRFRLLHRREAHARGLIDGRYPSNNEYVALVEVWVREPRSVADRQRGALERAIMEIMSAEWAVYTRVPEVDLSPLHGKVDDETRMYRVIRELAERKSRSGCTLGNSGNPSNMRLLQIEVIRLSGAEAKLRTKEYWLLEWWSTRDQSYEPHYYEATNRQVYTLKKQGPQWIAIGNEYPPPQLHPSRIPDVDRGLDPRL